MLNVTIVDVSGWKEDVYDASGSRTKWWLINPDGVKFVFKIPKGTHGSLSIGENYSEFLAYKLGTQLFNLKIPEIKFAVRNGVQGVISKNFIDKKYEFLEISDYFQEFNLDFNTEHLPHYKLSIALKIMDKFSMLQNFFEMCIFDILIANQDRHCENWGILKEIKKGEFEFAPLYDNGSSLGCYLTEARIQNCLGDERAFNGFNNRAYTIFTIKDVERPKISMFIEELISHDKPIFERAFSKFSIINYDSIYKVINIGEDNFFTKSRKEFIIKLIISRVNLINKFLLKGD